MADRGEPQIREGNRFVDVFLRHGGTFGFEEFRKDPEDMGTWTRVAYLSPASVRYRARGEVGRYSLGTVVRSARGSVMSRRRFHGLMRSEGQGCGEAVLREVVRPHRLASSLMSCWYLGIRLRRRSLEQAMMRPC